MAARFSPTRPRASTAPSSSSPETSPMPTRGRDGDEGNGEQQRSFLEAPAPHYTGHRERLRERFLKGGADALPDYELLELVLFAAILRRDVKPLAKALLAQFGRF